MTMHDNWKKANFIQKLVICHECGESAMTPRMHNEFDNMWICNACGATKTGGSGGATIYYNKKHEFMRKIGGLHADIGTRDD